MNITHDILGKTKYTSLLPMSYMVPTFYPTLPGSVQPEGLAPQITLKDSDLQARAQRLVNVLYWTAETYKNQDGMTDAGTLKVFIAPEFYFRKASDGEVNNGSFLPGTSFGSYPENSRYELAEALYAAIHSSPLFKDWVIVAGSICSVLPLNSTGRMNLLNSAIMLRGPREVMDASVPYILMEKHYISHIDGPEQSAHANLDPSTTYSFQLNPDQHLDNIVYWDDMSVGLEVCLDHSKQVVSNAMNLISQTLGPRAATLDLQLVTSCGMSIVEQAVAVEDGALIMLTDGMSHWSRRFPEPIFQLGRYEAKTGRTQLIDNNQFQFSELPASAGYQVDYANGNYGRLGRRQGVWTSKKKLAILQTSGP
jgi:hypothetical protein